MFLASMDPSEQRAFAGLALAVIRSDGILARQEAEIMATLGIGTSDAPSSESIEELAAAFTTRRTRVSALLELLGLGIADGEVSAVEKDLIERIAAVMGIEEDDLRAMENWVARQVALSAEATEFWTDES